MYFLQWMKFCNSKYIIMHVKAITAIDNNKKSKFKIYTREKYVARKRDKSESENVLLDSIIVNNVDLNDEMASRY